MPLSRCIPASSKRASLEVSKSGRLNCKGSRIREAEGSRVQVKKKSGSAVATGDSTLRFEKSSKISPLTTCPTGDKVTLILGK